MKIFSVALINMNFGHLTVMYVVLMNIACQYSYHLFLLTCKNETKLKTCTNETSKLSGEKNED